MVQVEEIIEESLSSQQEYERLMKRVKTILPEEARSTLESILSSSSSSSCVTSDNKKKFKKRHDDYDIDEENLWKRLGLQSCMMTAFLSIILGFMEYVVCERFPQRDMRWALSMGNTVFQKWLLHTLTNSVSLFPIVYLTYKWKHNKWFDIFLMIVSIIVSGSMIYIVRYIPTQYYYSFMPGLSALWILTTGQMKQATSFLSLCCTIIFYYMTLFQF
jgi:hypothetical protein